MLSKIKIFSNEIPRHSVDTSFFTSKLKSLDEKLTTLSQEAVKVEEFETISKSIIDLVENDVRPFRATLIDQDVRVKSITDRFEVLIDYLTDNGKISMPDIQRKLSSIKPAEIRTMKQNVTTLVSKSSTTDDRLVEAETKLNTVDNTVSNLNILVASLAIPGLLTLTNGFTGKLHFKNFGEWGILHGTITTTTNLSSTNAVCNRFPWSKDYEDFILVNKIPFGFKITRGALFIIVDRQNSSNLHFQFKHFIA
jgi:hypothetical protein